MYKVYTFGYGGRKPSDLVDYMEALGAKVIDIRFNVFGGHPLYHKAKMEAKFGERYRWVHHLGNVNYRGGEIKIKDWAGGLKRLTTMLGRYNVILLCGCKDYRECHRSHVADELVARLGVKLGGHLGETVIPGQPDPEPMPVQLRLF